MAQSRYEIWVAGYPSFFGGADTELDHNLDLWRRFGVDVFLVPMFGHEPTMEALCSARGCITQTYRPDIFAGRTVVSFCNGEFLKRLPEIMEAGRPRRVIWFNCMTWTFPDELTAHRNGWIDLHGFNSRYQRALLKPALEAIAPVQELEAYRPYFNVDNASQEIAFAYRPPREFFAVGRVSRDDAAKYSPDTWKIFDKVCAPLPKKVFILGYGPNAHQRCGEAPSGLDWQTWLPNEVPVRRLYQLLHCLIHKTGGSRESYCRVIPEAYAFGVPVVVEDDFAFPELVVNGVTGFRCTSSDEMSFRCSELAFDEARRKRMIEEARRFLFDEIACPEKCWHPWQQALSQ